MCMLYKCVSLMYNAQLGLQCHLVLFCGPDLALSFHFAYQHCVFIDIREICPIKRTNEIDTRDRIWEARKFAKHVKRTVFVRSDCIFSQYNSIVYVCECLCFFFSSISHSDTFISSHSCLPDVISFSKAII